MSDEVGTTEKMDKNNSRDDTKSSSQTYLSLSSITEEDTNTTETNDSPTPEQSSSQTIDLSKGAEADDSMSQSPECISGHATLLEGAEPLVENQNIAKAPEVKRDLESPEPGPSNSGQSLNVRVRRDSPVPVRARPKIINIQIPKYYEESGEVLYDFMAPDEAHSSEIYYNVSHQSDPMYSMIQGRYPFSALVCEFCESLLRRRFGWSRGTSATSHFTSRSGITSEAAENRAALRRLEDLLLEVERYSAFLDMLRRDGQSDLDYYQEKRMCQRLLYEIFPKPFVLQLRKGGPVEVEYYKAVTICFSEIEDFDEIAAESNPVDLIDSINDMVITIDQLIIQHNVCKVESASDAYIVVSGMLEQNDENNEKNAQDVAFFAMKLLDQAAHMRFSHLNRPLLIRVGIHTGHCAVGKVKTGVPRYCLFSETVNVAALMANTSKAQMIQISGATKMLLDQNKNFRFLFRGLIQPSGLEIFETYFMLRKWTSADFEPLIDIDEINDSSEDNAQVINEEVDADVDNLDLKTDAVYENSQLPFQGPESPAANSLEQSQGSLRSTSSTSGFNASTTEPTVGSQESPCVRYSNTAFKQIVAAAHKTILDIEKSLNFINDQLPNFFPDAVKTYDPNEVTGEDDDGYISNLPYDKEFVIKKGHVRRIIQMFNKRLEDQ